MKGSQGLDALAALCGGATKASENGAPGVVASTSAPPAEKDATIAPAAMQNGGSHARSVPGPAGALRMPFPENMAPSSSEAHQQQQQWQQAVASAASYGGAASNAATAALLSAANTPNLANSNGEASALNAMQQLAYYQYMQHAAAAAAQAAQLGKAPVVPVGQFVDPSMLSGQQNGLKLGEYRSRLFCI